MHPSGAPYEILDDTEPVSAPQWLLKKLGQLKHQKRKTETVRDGTKRVSEGSRNSTLMSLAGTVQRKGTTLKGIQALLLAENEGFDPPLETNEVLSIAKNVTRYEPTDRIADEPQIVLGERPYAQVVTDAESILKNCSEDRIFQTPQNRLVRVVQYGNVKHSDKFTKRDPEACVLADVDIQYLRLALGRTGRVLRYDESSKCIVPTDAPRQLAEMLLSSVTTSPEKTSWHRLKKISVTPILLLDGRLVSEPGYHAESRIWSDTRKIRFVDPAADNPKLSSKECRSLIEETIHPIFCMYPLAKERAGQHWFETGAFAVVLSALMCIDDRHNLSAVPMHCVSAPTQS
jgi:hypothetical protein